MAASAPSPNRPAPPRSSPGSPPGSPKAAQVRPSPSVSRAGQGGRSRAEPFRSAAEAWFWTMAALTARHDGARPAPSAGRVTRPCEPDDVIRCLDALYRARRITLAHARVLRVWGGRQTAPSPNFAAERAEAALWTAALERLEWPLRVKGIVA